MVRFTRRGVLKNASYIPKAIGWASELNSYFNDNYDVELHFGVELFGEAAMVWYVDADDLATVESINMQLMQDTDYWNIVEQASDFWVEGSLQDTMVNMIG